VCARRHYRRAGITAVLYTSLLVALALLASALWKEHLRQQQGVVYGLPSHWPHTQVDRPGVNVQLAQYGAADLDATLDTIRASGFRWLRQRFPWDQIEPQPGKWRWQPWDRIVAASVRRGFRMVAVLDGSPTWARAPEDVGNPLSPPSDPADFGRFAAAFARRYAASIDHYQIWDEPNIAPHWGARPVDPVGYARLLREAAVQIRTADPGAVILSAALAPTTEAGPINLSDIEYLRQLYAAGAAESFDILAVEPYGFDYPPDDRRVAPDRLNFSRVLLLQETMVAAGDGRTPVWATAFGWNALSRGWLGGRSIWGQVSEAQQADYAVQAIQRAADEWPWMGPLFWARWQPDAPSDDPVWGFALLDSRGRPRPVLQAFHALAATARVATVGWHAMTDPAVHYEGSWRVTDRAVDVGQSGNRLQIRFRGTRLDLRVQRGPFWALLFVTVDGRPANALPRDGDGRAYLLLYDPLSAPATVTLARHLPDGEHEAELIAQGGWGQWAITGFAVSREPDLASSYLKLVLLLLVAAAAAWRLGWWLQLLPWRRWWAWSRECYWIAGTGWQLAALAAVIGAFYLIPWPPLLLLPLAALGVLIYWRLPLGLAAAVFAVPFYFQHKEVGALRLPPVEVLTLLTALAWVVSRPWQGGGPRQILILRRLNAVDWAVVALGLISLVSLGVAAQPNAAWHEFRLLILGPWMLYLLVRCVPLTPDDRQRLADALLLAGVMVTLVGGWQLLFTGSGVVVAGVRRMRSVYFSPNHGALFLERLFPLALTMALVKGSGKQRRLAYLAALLLILLGLFLTYSRAAWLLGLPAGAIVVLVGVRGRRLWRLGGASVLMTIGLVVFYQRGWESASLLRLDIWRSALAIWGDHPWLGVGLGNFQFAYLRYVRPAAWQEPRLYHPHNVWLAFGTRLGVAGLMSFLWLMVAFWLAGWRSLKRLAGREQAMVLGLLAGMAAGMAHGLVDAGFFLTDLAYLTLLAAALLAK